LTSIVHLLGVPCRAHLSAVQVHGSQALRPRAWAALADGATPVASAVGAGNEAGTPECLICIKPGAETPQLHRRPADNPWVVTCRQPLRCTCPPQVAGMGIVRGGTS
jgi:hypothetical protein